MPQSLPTGKPRRAETAKANTGAEAWVARGTSLAKSEARSSRSVHGSAIIQIATVALLKEPPLCPSSPKKFLQDRLVNINFIFWESYSFQLMKVSYAEALNLQKVPYML